MESDVSRNQMIFDRFYRDQIYGPRGGLQPRDWQFECAEVYDNSILAHEERVGRFRQHCFCVYAGTGAGKTNVAGLLASTLLNSRRVGQVVVVCPNRSISRKSRRVFRENFGIELVQFHARKYGDGIPRTKNGYILTYAHLMQAPELHRRICLPEKTLVVFDEVHHLGDGNSWGVSAVEAFGHVPHVLTLTGTPYRSDNTIIPFVTYEDTDVAGLKRFSADPLRGTGYTYSLGRAVTDTVCRKPLFCFHQGEVIIRFSVDSPEMRITFADDRVNDAVSAHRLRGAVRYGSSDRRSFLAKALGICREQRRKVAIFLGGDTEGDHTPTYDATVHLPDELEDIGIARDEIEVITGDDKSAQEKIEAFGSSEKWILVSVNMVSEGVDIPELSAAIFLTSITAKQTTYQRIGRVLRLMGMDDRHPDALIFMFADPNLVALADEVEREILQEVRLRNARREHNRGEAGERGQRVEAIGVGDGAMLMVKFNGQEWPAAMIEHARREVRENGLPMTMLDAVLKLMREKKRGDSNAA